MPPCLVNSCNRLQLRRRTDCNFGQHCPYRPTSVLLPIEILYRMPSSVANSRLLLHRFQQQHRSVVGCKCLSGGRIASSGGKRSASRSRTAHLLARADTEGMDRSSLIQPTKQDKQVTFASQTEMSTGPFLHSVAHVLRLQILTLPTVLTLMRVASIPVLIGGQSNVCCCLNNPPMPSRQQAKPMCPMQSGSAI